ncbi:hypothetical protein CO676_29850 [Sinorhizobium sp. BJ1]|nr:hypothetical protein CO676_29850 [Sinorhizobium sp. BJ1]
MAWVVGIGIFLFLLLGFPKQVGSLILLIVLAGGGVALYYYLDQQAYARKKAQIITEVGTDPACSDPRFPLKIQFTNTTAETLMRVSFSLEGFRPGYSDVVVSDYLLSSDRIMRPRDVYAACWGYPVRYGKQVNYPGLKWVAKVTTATFAK